MMPRFLGLAQFKGNCKMPDPQNLVHLSRGLLVKCIIEILLFFFLCIFYNDVLSEFIIFYLRRNVAAIERTQFLITVIHLSFSHFVIIQ